MYFLRRAPLALLFAIATQAIWAQLYTGSLPVRCWTFWLAGGEC
jgi:hypothetical protein